MTDPNSVIPLPTAEPAGPPGWLETAYAAHYQSVYRAALRVTGNPSDAEDVLQTVFTRVWRRQEVSAGDDQPLLRPETAGPYLRRAAVHAALDVLRARQRAGWAPLEDAERLDRLHPTTETPRGPEDERRRRDLARALRQALARLSPRAAEIFSLRYFEGLGHREIGERVGTSAPVIAVLLHRARRRLQKELSAWDLR